MEVLLDLLHHIQNCFFLVGHRDDLHPHRKPLRSMQVLLNISGQGILESILISGLALANSGHTQRSGREIDGAPPGSIRIREQHFLSDDECYFDLFQLRGRESVARGNEYIDLIFQEPPIDCPLHFFLLLVNQL